MKKTIKRIVATVMALATVMTCAMMSAGATNLEGDTVTANVYVKGSDNTVLKGTTAYMTPGGWSTNILPTSPSSDNAKMVEDGDTVKIIIPLNNSVFRFKDFGDGAQSYVSGDMTAEVTAKSSDGYATELTYTFVNGAFETENEYRIEGCTCYARPAAIVGDNAGIKTFAVTMKVDG